MAKNNRSGLLSSATEYNRYYTDMRGVDLSGDGSGIHRQRFSYLENMYRDYDGEGAGGTESFPGFRRLYSFPGKIHGIYVQKNSGGDMLLCHAGTSLYRFPLAERDGLSGLQPIGTLADRTAAAFCHGTAVFLLDGQHYLRVNEDGSVDDLYQKSEQVYTPITFINGEEYEQRNLLSPRFSEYFDIAEPLTHRYESEGLLFLINDEDPSTCLLAGRGSCDDVFIHVPKSAYISGTYYPVSGVRTAAFRGDCGLRELYLAEGITNIGPDAFSECPYLEKAVLAHDTRRIGERAFSDCPTLRYVYLGRLLDALSTDAFLNTPRLGNFHFGGTYTRYSAIENGQIISQRGVVLEATNREDRIYIPLYDPAYMITEMRINGELTNFTTKLNGERRICGVIFYTQNTNALCGARVTLSGTLLPDAYAESVKSGGFLSEHMSYLGGAEAAILGCRLCEVFDGRVFLGGNPALPNTVFYSCRDRNGRSDPTYFGVHNYFSDGVGNFPVSALLSVGQSLAVFKGGDDGGGTVYLHTPMETGNALVPKAYPVSTIHSGIVCLGGALSFYDDPVFITESGLCALDKQTLNLERNVSSRSHNVNERLLCENLKAMTMTQWNGYLILCGGGHMYLADSRQSYLGEDGGREYEWYFLNGIGTYQNYLPRYRYGDMAPPGYHVHPSAGKEPEATVYSVGTEEGTVYYTREEGGPYAVTLCEELRGEGFAPATAVLGEGGLLFFGTENGALCLFNHDRRGIAPPYITASPDFDAAAYALEYGQRIHPYYYDFAGVAPRYALSTAKDSCDIPHLTKSTVKRSLVIKCRGFCGARICAEVGTDRGGYRELARFPGGEFSFAELDFSSLSADVGETFTLPLSEKEKNWVEKQISLYAQDFRSPIGIYTIAYRYTVSGRIKPR